MMEKKLRVLVAEDAPPLIATALAAVFADPENQLELSVVGAMSTLVATIELTAPEAIFLDLALGRPDPLEAVRRVHRAAPGIPLIVCAEVSDKGLASRSLSEGAMDYLLKGFMDARTIERVLRQALERNTLDALTDFLRDDSTGLYTRDGFLTLGTRAMDAAVRSGGTLVLLCTLIENLSTLRQNVGNAASDQAVLDTADILKSCFRRSDLLARLGSAQFAALAVEAAEPSAPILRQRVQARIAARNQEGKSRGPVELRLSVGYWERTTPGRLLSFWTAWKRSCGRRRPRQSSTRARAPHAETISCAATIAVQAKSNGDLRSVTDRGKTRIS